MKTLVLWLTGFLALYAPLACAGVVGATWRRIGQRAVQQAGWTREEYLAAPGFPRVCYRSRNTNAGVNVHLLEPRITIEGCITISSFEDALAFLWILDRARRQRAHIVRGGLGVLPEAYL